jgi:hypothetical protein
MGLFLVEGSGFFDPKTFEYAGKETWLLASERHSVSELRMLHNLGFTTSGTDHRGWNCLFMSIMSFYDPSTSEFFEKVQFLLGVFDDVYAQDIEGRTIFDLVNEDRSDSYSQTSYRRDVWYCALERAGIDVRDYLTRHPHIAVRKSSFREAYTPEHYHALKHLQSWDESNFRSQMDRLLEEIPLEEEESHEMERIRELERLQTMERMRKMKYIREDDQEWWVWEDDDEKCESCTGRV